MSIYIGLDPGKKGAMAIIGDEGITLIPFNADKYIETLKWIKEDFDVKCCIEQVHSLPREGVKSVWSFGQSYGWLLGILDSIGIPYQTVPPNLWKKEFSLIKAEKKQSIEVCKRLFPNVNLKRSDKCRKEDDNLADAALICEYCRRKMK